MRARRLLKHLRKEGCTVDRKQGKGSHAVISRPGVRPYTLPLHNGDDTELDDCYVNKCCQQLKVKRP